MSSIHLKNFNSPDETRTPDKTKVEVLQLGDQVASRITFQPGWKWSECLLFRIFDLWGLCQAAGVYQ